MKVVETSEYLKLLLHPQWLKKRKEILLRDNRLCRNCGGSGGLQVHHRQYHLNPRTGKFRFPWDYSNKYLITLCVTCHHKGYKKFTIPNFKH